MINDVRELTTQPEPDSFGNVQVLVDGQIEVVGAGHLNRIATQVRERADTGLDVLSRTASWQGCCQVSDGMIRQTGGVAAGAAVCTEKRSRGRPGSGYACRIENGTVASRIAVQVAVLISLGRYPFTTFECIDRTELPIANDVFQEPVTLFEIRHVVNNGKGKAVGTIQR